MERLEHLFTVLSPFISAYLVYYFGVKDKRKNIDLDKEKELNVVLSNLLVVWNNLKRIEKVINLMKVNPAKSIVPLRFFPFLILNTEFFNNRCFSELDNSVDVLKKYDPILYYELEGTGELLDNVRRKYIMPYIENHSTQPELIVAPKYLLDDALIDLEKYMKQAAGKIDKKTLSSVEEYIKKRLNSSQDEFIDELNQKYFDVIMQLMPEGTKKPSLEEFIELAKTDEFKEILEMQFNLVINNSLGEFLEIIRIHPEYTVEEVKAELAQREADRNIGST